MSLLFKSLWFWLAFIFGAIILLPTLWFANGGDHGIYSYVAWAWIKYHLPLFKSGFEHNFPGIYFITYFAFRLFGDSELSIRIVDFIFQMINLALIFYLTALSSKKEHEYVAGFIASLLYALFYINLDFYYTAQKDGFALTFLLVAAAAYLGFNIENGRNWTGIIITGLIGLPPFLIPLIMLGFPLFPGSGSGAKGQSSPQRSFQNLPLG